jgi:hypothetical protein
VKKLFPPARYVVGSVFFGPCPVVYNCQHRLHLELVSMPSLSLNVAFWGSLLPSLKARADAATETFGASGHLWRPSLR